MDDEDEDAIDPGEEGAANVGAEIGNAIEFLDRLGAGLGPSDV